MKLEDAPPPGWYPDPEGRGRLRWWEGTDWAAARRVPASTSEVQSAIRAAAEAAAPEDLRRPRPTEIPRSQLETRQLVEQMREAAREEADRAGQMFTRQAMAVVDRARSVVVDYMRPILRWIRIAVVVGALLVIAWFIIQFIAQASLLNWLGDRIDNLVN